ncbi:hypothetical protein B0T24DRAFT_643303 [Lasiosphaeria ovina]|uniref:Fungal N-terminal domain-containing protein n=1 Tax=Lasiosphaeria ovina TaxID=92902 RepID=A0AAE0JSC2_9PEZI|nr:hypothetical protein B0T24DRAFT_643303 [Lasiosphaeria ovina]
MDPFTAVSFAATILAFVDFSWGLAKGTYEVYQSATGQTVENVHINDVISDLRSVSEDLDGTPSGDSKHEKALRRLAAECSELSAELMALLKKLKRSEKKNSVWGSLRVKWASIRKAADVESILDRLREYRSEIMLRLSLMLKYCYPDCRQLLVRCRWLTHW